MLADRGAEVLVLEARARLGGRTWTDSRLGVPVDLGAAWIEGVDGNPLTGLARRADLRTLATGDSIAAYDHDGRRLGEDEIESIGSEFDALLETAEGLAGEVERDISLGEAMRRALGDEAPGAAERRALDWAMASMATDSAADFDEMSLLGADDDDGFDGESVILPGGYVGIVDYLARGLEVRLAQAVRRIRVLAAGVEVYTHAGRHAADRVVVSVPLGVLAGGGIAFEPGLPPAKRGAIAALRMGVLDKAVLRFPRVAWPGEQNFAFLSARAGEWPTFLNLAPTLGEPLLVGFCAGGYARWMEQQEEARVRARVTAILRTMFGRALPEPTGFLRTRWIADPWTRGSYSFVPVGADAELRDRLAEPVGGRLYFAGEATSRRYPATVHGAYLSGVREAERIVAA